MRVIVVAGASGGHIYPALGLISALKEKQPSIEIIFALPKRCTLKQVAPDDCRVKYISTTQITFRPELKNISAAFRYLLGAAQCLETIIQFKPDIVVGFGSIDSIPLVMFAWLFRIRTIIHEQNVVPGRANRLLAKFADKIALSFVDTRNYWRTDLKRTVITGNPIRRALTRIERSEAMAFFGFKDKFSVLVMGGSQSSVRINKFFLDAAAGQNKNIPFQVIHIAGEKDAPWVAEAYKNAGIQAKVYPYLEEMKYAYSAADLAVCRAGASTIAELLHYALPSIIIPYPYAYAHQLQNALVLKTAGSAIIIEDNKLESGELNEKLGQLLDFKAIDNMRLSFGGLENPNAGDLLAEAVLGN